MRYHHPHLERATEIPNDIRTLVRDLAMHVPGKGLRRCWRGGDDRSGGERQRSGDRQNLGDVVSSSCVLTFGQQRPHIGTMPPRRPKLHNR